MLTRFFVAACFLCLAIGASFIAVAAYQFPPRPSVTYTPQLPPLLPPVPRVPLPHAHGVGCNH